MLELLARDKLKVESRDHHHSKEYINLSDELEKIENQITEKLDEEGKELFESYIGKQLDMSELVRIEEFIYGYQLGSLIMIDIYDILKR